MDLENNVVVLKGVGATALEIRLDSNIFDVSSCLKFPIWDVLKKIYCHLDAHQLTQYVSVRSGFLNFIDIPPFLENSI